MEWIISKLIGKLVLKCVDRSTAASKYFWFDKYCKNLFSNFPFSRFVAQTYYLLKNSLFFDNSPHYFSRYAHYYIAIPPRLFTLSCCALELLLPSMTRRLVCAPLTKPHSILLFFQWRCTDNVNKIIDVLWAFFSFSMRFSEALPSLQSHWPQWLHRYSLLSLFNMFYCLFCLF